MVASKHKQQLRLQMEIPVSHEYGTWLRHAGVEVACDRLALWSVHGGMLWLTSEGVAGKSHLLRTLATEYAISSMLHVDTTIGTQLNSLELAQQWEKHLSEQHHWLIDMHAGTMDLSLAHALFHLIERGRDQQVPMAIAWRGDLQNLPAELSSRLLAMEKVAMSAPALDDDLLQILHASAGNLQWDIRAQVLQAMLTYLPRQLDVLVAALHELETLSFEQKHKPGPAWVKQQLLRIANDLAQH